MVNYRDTIKRKKNEKVKIYLILTGNIMRLSIN